MALFLAALVLLYRTPALHAPLAPLDRWTAAATAALSGLAGLPAVAEGVVVEGANGFSYEIAYRCTGLVHVALFLAGLAALPAARKPRAAVAGAAAILAVNQLRLVSLLWLGGVSPAAFDFAHSVLWEAGMLAAVLAAWLACLSRARRLGQDVEERLRLGA